jgi:predicted O-methyltransferase YrrM|tara:strand:- start:5656 stop:6102 length:447 start_codon:yes stop_codon:yes gene_type:complete
MPDGATLIAVDLPMPVTEGGKVLKERAAELCADGFDCHVVLGDSKKPDIIGRVSSLTSGNIDVLLIDGDHSPEGVRADIKNYVPMVRPGGLVIFHNVGPCTWGNEKSERLVAGVFPAWKELAQQHPQCMLVQELAGYGLVWIGDDCPR